MRLPSKGTRGVVVLDRLYASACPAAEIVKRHAEFGIGFAALEAVFEGLIAAGCADLTNGVYSITKAARSHFDRASSPPAVTGAPVAPAYRPQTGPLKRPAVRIGNMREGASDYQAIPSRVGDRRYPHGQGK